MGLKEARATFHWNQRNDNSFAAIRIVSAPPKPWRTRPALTHGPRPLLLHSCRFAQKFHFMLGLQRTEKPPRR